MSLKKKALITGISGQSGSYLAELLLEKGYEVHGIRRRSSQLNTSRIDHLYTDPHHRNVRLFLHYGDLTDSTNLIRVVQEVQPDEIYNLGAQSHVAVSFETPEYTANSDALGTLRLLEAIRILKLQDKTKFIQASTSEMFGKVQETPQKETTPFYPRSPYGAAKLYAYWITVNYREAYNMFAINSILFNHESPRRGETFVTRKITRGIAQICYGLEDTIYLGNLNAERDWGHAKDYVYAQWLMMQQDVPQDYLIATGEKYSVKWFCERCFEHIGVKIVWKGEGIDEVGVVDSVDDCQYSAFKPGRIVICVDPGYYRPAEVELLLGDASKARRELNWQPNITIHQLIKEMMNHDLQHIKPPVTSDKEECFLVD